MGSMSSLSPDGKEALREKWIRVRAKLRTLGYAQSWYNMLLDKASGAR